VTLGVQISALRRLVEEERQDRLNDRPGARDERTARDRIQPAPRDVPRRQGRMGNIRDARRAPACRSGSGTRRHRLAAGRGRAEAAYADSGWDHLILRLRALRQPADDLGGAVPYRAQFGRPSRDPRAAPLELLERVRVLKIKAAAHHVRGDLPDLALDGAAIRGHVVVGSAHIFEGLAKLLGMRQGGA
jgi:hypothetical protein